MLPTISPLSVVAIASHPRRLASSPALVFDPLAVQSNSGERYLFHLESDPGETKNLLEDNPGLSRNLANLLDNWEAEVYGEEPRTF